jgi:hypothetical protein
VVCPYSSCHPSALETLNTYPFGESPPEEEHLYSTIQHEYDINKRANAIANQILGK